MRAHFSNQNFPADILNENRKIFGVAEIISSVSIVLTLIYLTVQTGQMSAQTEQMTTQSVEMNVRI